MEKSCGVWRRVEECGGVWRRVEKSGGEWMRVDESGGEWRGKRGERTSYIFLFLVQFVAKFAKKLT